MVPDLLWLFLGIACVLLLATIVGQILRRRSGDSDVIENLNARVNSWWAMVILIALAFMAGRTGVVILFAICSFAALREFATLMTTRRADHWALIGAFFVVLPIQYWAIWIDWYGFYSIFIPVYAFLGMPVLAALRGETDDFLMRISQSQWGLMICVFCASHVPALLSLEIDGFDSGRNILLIAFLIVVVQSSDVLQYVWGKLLGKRKIAPKLSPSKTVEGLIGGVLSASLVGALLFWMTPFSFVQAGLMALVITLMGFLGGLVMSTIKRDRGVKDWGHTIAGHGGFIDRLDSVVFSAPIFFHLTRYFWT